MDKAKGINATKDYRPAVAKRRPDGEKPSSPEKFAKPQNKGDSNHG